MPRMEVSKVNLADVPVQHQQWGDGRYDRKRRHLSAALGHLREKRHPFDVEYTVVAPGCFNCPHHSHSRMTEFFIIVAGRGRVERNDEVFEVGPGDIFIQPPGTFHHILNASETEDLAFYIIADEVDGCELKINRP